MGSYNTAVITTVGQALLTSVLGAQGTMTFTKLQTSSYAYASGTDLSALTSLNNVEQEANIGTATIVDSTHIAADATISNSGISTEYSAYTLGIFASDGVNEVLFAVSTAVTPDVIPVDQGGTPSTYKYKFTLAVSSTSDITISAIGDIDASDIHYDNSVSGLSATNVQAAIDEIVSSVKRTGTITPSEVSVELTNATPTVTVSFTTNSDGVASVASSDPTIATASLSGTVVTITGLKSGTPTVTISIPETDHFTACSATIAVECNIITPGNVYFFGGFWWTAAEDLGNGAVCMQSQGMTEGSWPGYKLTSDYSGTKSYGSADTAYGSNIDGDNIANYDEVTQAWYAKYSSVEKTGQAYGSGLFLVSNAKCNVTTSDEVGSGNYWSALVLATDTVNYKPVWIGTVDGSTYAWRVGSSGKVSKDNYNQSWQWKIAPAFNLDTTKIKLVDDHIMLPTEEMPTLKTFATATDAEIAAMVQASEKGIIDLYEDAGWRVGQEHQISLSAIAASGTYDGVSWTVGEAQNAQSATLVLMHHKPIASNRNVVSNAYKLVTPPECGRKVPSFAVGLKNAMETLGYMNATNTNSGSWESSARRNWCNGGFREVLPSAIRGISRKFYCVTGDYNGTATGGANKTTEDYFALTAEKEILGSSAPYTSTSNETNALIQFTWYESADNRVKKQGGGGSACSWWERSPQNNAATRFCGIKNGGGSDGQADASNAIGLSPFGMIP